LENVKQKEPLHMVHMLISFTISLWMVFLS